MHAPAMGLLIHKVSNLNIEAIARGLMGGKKIKGRKRHVCTDTQGNLLFIKVHAANIHDSIAGCDVAYQSFRRYSSIRAFCADLAYRGTTKLFVEDDLKLCMDITSKSEKTGFEVIKKRWVVERFFAWIGNFRRFSKDYEILACVSEEMIMIAAIVLLLNKLF